jgi:hypothetical protein
VTVDHLTELLAALLAALAEPLLVLLLELLLPQAATASPETATAARTAARRPAARPNRTRARRLVLIVPPQGRLGFSTDGAIAPDIRRRPQSWQRNGRAHHICYRDVKNEVACPLGHVRGGSGRSGRPDLKR